ncbi:hypothetical protein ACVINW_004641 [Bradyrhizobium sp. USDA 4461]
MHHLVDDHPVALQIVGAGVAADQQQPQRTDGKPAIIDRDRAGGGLDPVEYPVLAQCHLAGGKGDMDGAAGHVEIGLRQPVEGFVGHAIAAHELRLRLDMTGRDAEDGGGDEHRRGDHAICRDAFHRDLPRPYSRMDAAVSSPAVIQPCR